MVEYLKHPLDGCIARIRRANEHLADLKRLIDAAFVQQAKTIPINFDPNPPYRQITLRQPVETYFGMSVAVRIGEVCYNIRSALDYLVFELAKLDSGAEQIGTQFPIEDDPNRFRGNASRMLVGLNTAHVAAIERLQPYKGCDWTKSLREASNPDKHRHFVKARGEFIAHAYSALDDDLSRIVGHLRTEPHPVYGTVNVKIHLTGTVAFSDGTPIIETLEKIACEATDTLHAFKSEF